MLKFWISIGFLFFKISVHCQEPVETIPFKLVNNLIFLEVQINNSNTPLNFIFDTGAGITVIDNKVAGQLSLDINAESKISTSGKSLLSKESQSNRVKIGKNIILDSISLILMDLNHLSRYLNTDVDGVIGYDLLNKYITETNIDTKDIRFYEPNSFIYNGNSEPIALTPLESNLFGIMINVASSRGQEPILLNFQIDTGADNYLSFHNKTVKKHHLVNARKKQNLRKGFGADSTLTTNIKSKIKSVSFGGKTWKNIPVMLEVDPINKRENTLADGLIGQRLLLDFNIIYNLEKRILYLEEKE